jgi:hypothetical protein
MRALWLLHDVMAYPHTTAIWNRDKSELDACQQLDD